MDSTPSPPSHSLPLKSSSASKPKLPIKRKTLPSSQDPSFPNPNPNSPFNPPPYKFHRIWTEPDEIRFLQGLLDSVSDGLLFPRDLHLFYHRFSATMSQPYTKSQLSEKLRRLRKKFRAVSSRLHRRGLNPATALSFHDRALFDLSNRLWGSSPFGNSGQNPNPNRNDGCCDAVDRNMGIGCCHERIGGVAAKIVLDVFDECVKEAKLGLLWQGIQCSQNEKNFRRRWQEQHALEMDVFARRLKLVIENSLGDH